MKLFSYLVAGGLLMSVPVLAHAQGQGAPEGAQPETAPELKQPEKAPEVKKSTTTEEKKSTTELKETTKKADASYKARHDVKGEITEVDKSTGELRMKTADGELRLSFPPSAVQKLEKGDEVSVELAIKPMAKPNKAE